MDNIIRAISENDLDQTRTMVTQALAEKARDALQVRKAEIAASFFTPKAD